MHKFAHVGSVLVRCLVASIGFCCLYIGLFLHEDEEGELKNRLEELWIKIDDLKGKAQSKESALLQEIMRLVTLGFNKLLGKKLFSFSSIIVITCYSIASYNLVYGLVEQQAFEDIQIKSIFVISYLLLCAIPLVLGTIWIKIKGVRSVAIWIIVAAIASIGESYLNYRYLGPFAWSDIFVYVAIPLGLLCDIFFVACNRILIRFSSTLTRLDRLIVMLLVNTFLAVIYIAPIGWALGLPETGTTRLFIAYIAFTNVFTALSALSIVIIVFVALIHRLLWPLIERPVYAAIRHGVIERHMVLISSGLVLLAWALPAWKSFWEAVGRLK